MRVTASPIRPNMFISADTLPVPVMTYEQVYATIDVEGSVDELSEESIEEAALEEALAVAMAKRQGDE